jgi:hypothetical protein
LVIYCKINWSAKDVLSLFMIKRNRTSSRDIGYGLYLYFLGLSTRNVAKDINLKGYHHKEIKLMNS